MQTQPQRRPIHQRRYLLSSMPEPERSMNAIQPTDHVVMRGNAFLCKHCGKTYAIALPCPINVMVAAMKAYVADHQYCQPREPQK